MRFVANIAVDTPTSVGPAYVRVSVPSQASVSCLLLRLFVYTSCMQKDARRVVPIQYLQL